MKKSQKMGRWLWEWERQVHPVIIYQVALTYAFDRTWPYLMMPVLFVSKGQTVNLYFSSKIGSLSKLLVKKIESGKFLPVYKKLMAQEKRQQVAYCNKLARLDFHGLGAPQLAGLVTEFSSLYRQHGVTPIRTLNKAVPTYRVESFFKKTPMAARNMAEIKAVLFAPTRYSLEQESERYLYKIVKQLRSGTLRSGSVKGKILTYLKKYAFIPCGYADEKAYTVGDIKIKLREMQKNFSVAQRVTPTQRKRLIGRLHLPGKLVHLVNALSEFTYYKDFIRMNYNRLHFFSQPLFQEIANRFGISRRDVRYLTTLEIIDCLQKGKINKAIIATRKKFYVCLANAGGVYIKVGSEAKMLERQIDKVDTTVVELSGVVASFGKVRGVVRVVTDSRDIKNWPARAVMVTPMTTPELVPLAKKSIAIVTDEGGVTCHAAIISRELGIPCIIGTKIATKVFKNGNRVEVDAIKGTVRML